LRIDLRADARESADVTAIGLACEPRLGRQRPEWMVYSGYQSWDAAGVAHLRATDGAARASWWTCGLAAGSGRGIAAAALSALRAPTRFEWSDGRWLLTAEEPAGLEARPRLWRARPRATWRSDPLLVTAGPDVRDALRRAAARVRGRRTPTATPQGWLSWYHYGPWVSGADVVANADVLSGGPLAGLGYRYVQVDDGWQHAYGDWRPNAKFPGGLEVLAEELERRDQVLGVWTAPFLVSATSDLARSAPDRWFIKDPQTGGRAVDPNHVVFGPMHILDARVAAVRRHLEETFRALRMSGVRYFKIDFLYAGSYAGTRAVRAGVAAIRRGIGDDCYLLACGAPLLPVVGLADGCRIGRDTATPIFDFELGSPKPALIDDELVDVGRNQAARHFLDAWFQLDPDVALVGGNLTVEQARSLVTLCALSGGPFFASDHLAELPPERLALLRHHDVLRLVGGRPAVPDWEPNGTDRAPAVWRRDRVIAIFNWEPEARRTALPTGGCGRLKDLWTGEEIVVGGGEVLLEVPASGARLLELVEG
jgi:alpha-galactosidase